ncbi:class I SAM-dependent methyltransferase [Actinophytocola gossypii]|uniref:Class I SAM-dependent methyltransferase n=1 Tax=Actinophytocola gossypii TaxID=2812003 RepID=A0ABT2J4Y2_9PSEU|nr:class I SAM-dependent methyltransferase [Actinophytocola gossypii]MCT2582550.1 class I SAM-dependent methyltransferase [Actinophytocola gossypii]
MTDSEPGRARSFGRRPAAYHEHRPGYPAAAIRWVLDVGTREPRHVLDLAAGTGKLTEGLLGLGFEVTSVEPDDGMRGVLAERFPAARAMAGTAEAIPLPDASVDAVLVGQAFHWFDLVAALTEIARVLRPGGALGVLWNGEDPDVDWVTELMAASSTSASPGFQGGLELPPHEGFGPVEGALFRHALPRTVESTVGYLSTHSRLLMVDAAERAEVLDRVRAYLRARPETAGGEFDLPLVTNARRLRRR